MTSYAGWSARQLKEAGQSVDSTPLLRMAELLARGQTEIDEINAGIQEALKVMMPGWSGQAAANAHASSTDTAQKADLSARSATAARTRMEAFAKDLADAAAQVRAMAADDPPNPADQLAEGVLCLPDTALSSPLSSPLSHALQAHQADQQRQALIAKITEMESLAQNAGAGLAGFFPIPSIESSVSPPASLPPAPGRGTGTGGTGSGRSTPAAPRRAAAPEQPERPRTDPPKRSDTAASEPGAPAPGGTGQTAPGPEGTPVPGSSQDAARPGGSSTVPAAAGAGTLPQSLTTPTAAGTPTSPTSSMPPGGAALPGGAAQPGTAGGAGGLGGALAGGALAASGAGTAPGSTGGGRPGTVSGGWAPGTTGTPGGEPPARGPSPRPRPMTPPTAPRPGTTAPLTAMPPGTGATGQAPRRTVGPAGTPRATTGGLPAAQPGVLPTGQPLGGQAGRPAPGRAGGAGRRRNRDSDPTARSDYLVTTDSVWGDGRTVARRVLGRRPGTSEERDI